MRTLVMTGVLIAGSSHAIADMTTLELPLNASLRFEAPKMTPLKEVQESGRYQYVASSMGESDERFTLSVYVEPIDCKHGNSLQQVARCFNERLDSAPGVVKEADSPVCKKKRCDVFYVVSMEQGGRTVSQLNLNSLFVYGNAWVDVHLSVVNPRAEDEKIFARFAASLKFSAQ